MKYIIMAGGKYTFFDTPKQLLKVKDEVIIERTIRLLKENGITDIAISTSNPAFDYIDVPKLVHKNTYVHEHDGIEAQGWWLDAFYPMNKPVCYIFGDVYFSDEAIKTIVETKTNDIEFFGSTPPFAKNYPKQWIEPFALKVKNTKHLKEAIEQTKQYAIEGKTWRKNPIIWELWCVIKNMPLEERPGQYVYNYYSINDYTSDIDGQDDILKLEKMLNKGGNEMVKLEVIETFRLGRFDEVKIIQRKGVGTYGFLEQGDIIECSKDLADYLLGDNAHNRAFVKIIEIIPEVKKEEVKQEVVKEEPKVEEKPIIKKPLKKRKLSKK